MLRTVFGIDVAHPFMAIWPSDHVRQSRFYCQKLIFEIFTLYIPIIKIVSLGRAFQMSYIDSKNCSEHLMTIGMGLDRACIEFQKWVFFGTPFWGSLISGLKEA